jgi:hypothetical protein
MTKWQMANGKWQMANDYTSEFMYKCLFEAAFYQSKYAKEL